MPPSPRNSQLSKHNELIQFIGKRSKQVLKTCGTGGSMCWAHFICRLLPRLPKQSTRRSLRLSTQIVHSNGPSMLIHLPLNRLNIPSRLAVCARVNIVDLRKNQAQQQRWGHRASEREWEENVASLMGPVRADRVFISHCNYCNPSQFQIIIILVRKYMCIRYV